MLVLDLPVDFSGVDEGIGLCVGKIFGAESGVGSEEFAVGEALTLGVDSIG